MNNIIDYSKVDHLVECLRYYTDPLIIEDFLFESWEEGWKTHELTQKQTMVISVEKYNVNLMVEKIMNSGIDVNDIQRMIDIQISCLLNNDIVEKSFTDELGKIGEIRRISSPSIDLKTVEEFIYSIQSVTNLLHMKESLNNYKGIDYKARLYDSKNIRVVKILSIIYHLILNSDPSSEMFSVLDSAIRGLLYKFNDFDYETSYSIHGNYMSDKVTKEEIALYKPDDVMKLFVELIKILETESDYIIDYAIEELNRFEEIIYSIQHSSSTLKESVVEFKNDDFFNMLESTFDDMAYELFGENSDDELDISKFIEFYNMATILAEREILNEASSRIITKGTEKVTKSIGNHSAKSRGMTSSNSKIDQVKRGARVIDDRASDAINRKIDQVINITKDAKREKLITGKNTVKLGKAVKTVIGIIAASGAAKFAFGPVVGAGVSAITALGAYALSKRTEEREKKRILLELETELKIVKEKIEDAKGDNAREQKYQLMRIQASLEKEITRIRHGLRYY